MFKRLLLQQVFCKYKHCQIYSLFCHIVVAILTAIMKITATTTAMEAAMNPTLVAMIHIMMLAMTMHCHIHVQATLQPVLLGFMDQINIGHVMWIHGLLDHIFTQDQDICNTFLDNNIVKF